jgi:hypothetical protein
MRQTEIVLGVEQRSLPAQAPCMLTPCVHPTADGGDMLTDVQIQPLNKRCVDLPAVLGEHLLNRLQSPEHNSVTPADQTPPPVSFYHLRVEQRRQWHPAWRGRGTLGMPTFGLSPLALVRQQRGHRVPKAVGQAEGYTVWSENLGHAMDHTLGHG